MLGEIDDLHMGTMDLAQEVVIYNEKTNVEVVIYRDPIPAPCPTLTPTSTTYSMNSRGPIEATCSCIVTN